MRAPQRPKWGENPYIATVGNPEKKSQYINFFLEKLENDPKRKKYYLYQLWKLGVPEDYYSPEEIHGSRSTEE